MALRVWPAARLRDAAGAYTGAKARPALRTAAANFQFRFPGDPSLFSAEQPRPPIFAIAAVAVGGKIFAQIFPQWIKGNTKEESLPDKCSEANALEKNYSWQIPINCHFFKILQNKESLLCEALQDKFGCISTLLPPAPESNTKSPQVFRKTLAPGIELSVWKDDLTRHTVDAVVNAANEDLRHGGGLALALAKAGGPEIEQESRSFVATFGKIPTGGIAVTGAGRLPCKEIIHAVGPRWVAMDDLRCMHELEKAITNILDYVTSKNACIKTVAIPALSSGIFQFPLDLCTQIIVHTIKVYFQQTQVACKLKEIHLVSNEDPTVAALRTASEQILGRNELESLMSQDAIPPSDTMVVNNLTLQVVVGRIELQETDVIVNSVNPHTGLKIGTISNSILQQAGDEMEKEFTEKLLETPPASRFILVTKGFKLSCQYVYHVLWSSEAHLTLKNAVKQCLKKCLELNVSSISFPALATGSIGMWKNAAAEIMFDEVLIFAKEHLKTQLLVKFVIFPEELVTYTTFSSEMAKKYKQLSLSSFSAVSVPQWSREEKSKKRPETGSPAINLMGSNKEEMHEAQEWIHRMLTLQDHHIIEHSHILYFGKKEHDILSQLQKTSGVSISEIISPGKAKLEIKGAQADLIEVVMNIEHLLCKVQEEMARRKERDLWSLSRQWTDQQPKSKNEMKENINFLRVLAPLTQELQDRKKQFEKCGLQVIKVEKIENVVLMTAFQGKKKLMKGRTHRSPVSHRLFQQVPHQFCNVVCRVGFQRMYSVPHDPKYGAGIYFTRNLKNLADQVKKTSATDKLIYVFEAEVLIGSFCKGHQLNIVPPPLSPGGIESHDSVVDSVSSPETFVIFSGTQAMPQYLWTCTQAHVRS
ncbi:protein mono-ADP-ribosyltransferase PARP9 [Choloepus didactylus]|uniref:protein mono-ADP-ribosyltransferase PARP9 n=1 Tax=Choloepus didactylus TaxID=27675 RepID=UPI0018A0BAD7|nr:protein mono-ADP-ribosyltransferase PARP9 [Choloepus didactylus]